jgi:hypothetical protein
MEKWDEIMEINELNLINQIKYSIIIKINILNLKEKSINLIKNKKLNRR